MRGMWLLLIALEIGYGYLGFMLYRGRRLYHPAWGHDFFIFCVPFIAVVAVATCLLLLQWKGRAKTWAAFGIAFGLSLIVFVIYLTAAINTYGA